MATPLTGSINPVVLANNFLADDNCPHDLYWKIVELRQVVFTEIIQLVMVNDLLLRVLGKSSEDLRVMILLSGNFAGGIV